MCFQSDPRFVSSLKSISSATSEIVILIGCLVLVGWVCGIPILRSLPPNLVMMKAVVT